LFGALIPAWPWQLQERHVQPWASNITYPGEELELYVDDDLPLGPNFTLPEEADLATSIIPVTPKEDDIDDIWGLLDEWTDQFPVEFHLFLYLWSEESLEEELLEWYGSGVKQWLYEEPRLILVLTKRDQKLAGCFYPSEPSAYAQQYEEGSYQPWSPMGSAWITEVLSARICRWLELCPIPQSILTKGSHSQPPSTNFKSANLVLLFHPNGSLQIQGLSQSRMSWYLIPPQDLLSLLARWTEYLNWLMTFGTRDLLEATQSLESLMKKHLSYWEPVKFNVQIPFIGPYRVTLKWLAWAIPEALKLILLPSPPGACMWANNFAGTDGSNAMRSCLTI
jgi:hypothetical protein